MGRRNVGKSCIDRLEIPGVKSLLYSLASFVACSFISLFEKYKSLSGCKILKILLRSYIDSEIFVGFGISTHLDSNNIH
ncbi:UNVERIFIED_CONTAM: hypothetical protein NCL1_33724 [Trichonephila clavipes]